MPPWVKAPAALPNLKTKFDPWNPNVKIKENNKKKPDLTPTRSPLPSTAMHHTQMPPHNTT